MEIPLPEDHDWLVEDGKRKPIWISQPLAEDVFQLAVMCRGTGGRGTSCKCARADLKCTRLCRPYMPYMFLYWVGNHTKTEDLAFLGRQFDRHVRIAVEFRVNDNWTVVHNLTKNLSKAETRGSAIIICRVSQYVGNGWAYREVSEPLCIMAAFKRHVPSDYPKPIYSCENQTYNYAKQLEQRVSSVTRKH